MCPHRPRCPSAQSPDALSAVVIARQPEQSWFLLCNGVVCFDDGGALLPDGRTVERHKALTAAEAEPGQPGAESCPDTSSV